MIVKTPSKPYIIVHLFNKVYSVYIYIIQWYNFGNAIYNTDTEYTRVIASTLIHAVVLYESAQPYRAMMVFLQSHRTQHMILRCYPNVSAILRRQTKSCLLCFFNNPLFNSQNFLFTWSLLLFRPKNGYIEVRAPHTRAGVAAA